MTTIRLAAVGDLLFTTRPGATVPGRGLEALSDEVLRLFADCDLVLANLECTLPGGPLVASEPRVLADRSQPRELNRVGITAVTLGNNHAFDAGDDGFHSLTTLLDERGIAWCGAGLNLDEAQRPLILNIKNLRIAILPAVAGSSGMYRFATKNSSGVPPLNTNELCRQIEKLRREVDHVILTPHWGEERFRFPSPAQIEQGRAFIDAGASLVLGHHPHVVQGLEFHRRAPIAYSLGNFLANEVYWENGDVLTWNRFERTGCLLLAELDADGVRNVQQIPVFDDGETLAINTSGQGERYLERANRYLRDGITPARYRREAFRVRTLLPILGQLRWDKLRRLRPEHIRKAFHLITRGMS
ncbi:CapA family protein [Trichloromonas sp.]|uniref:CapA family protein n=1 Tax=Trichloromonas sp. TaxID=3069249 RepID=UPI002A47673D|nr:CapA family protein [Trichloromonas sp.]